MNIPNNNGFNTDAVFSGGAGFFIEYHDIVKPVYLQTILKMIMTNSTYGMPVDIFKGFGLMSMVEWDVKRRYVNPLKSIDYNHSLDYDTSFIFFRNEILSNDTSIYTTSPLLNIKHMINVYKSQKMNFPIFIYSENYEKGIEIDCNSMFEDVACTYLHGELETCLKKCDQNFTYIFSNIELAKKSAKLLRGTCSHIIVASDYRYNIGGDGKMKYDLSELCAENPFIRMGTQSMVNLPGLVLDLESLLRNGSK